MSLDLALSSVTPKSAPRPARDGYTSQADDDRVDSLPGFKDDGNLPFGLYAGCGQSTPAHDVYMPCRTWSICVLDINTTLQALFSYGSPLVSRHKFS